MKWNRGVLPVLNIAIGGAASFFIGTFCLIIIMVLMTVLPILFFLAFAFRSTELSIDVFGFIFEYIWHFLGFFIIGLSLLGLGSIMMFNSIFHMMGYRYDKLINACLVLSLIAVFGLIFDNPFLEILPGIRTGYDPWFYLSLCGYLFFQSAFLVLYMTTPPDKEERKNVKDMLAVPKVRHSETG